MSEKIPTIFEREKEARKEMEERSGMNENRSGKIGDLNRRYIKIDTILEHIATPGEMMRLNSLRPLLYTTNEEYKKSGGVEEKTLKMIEKEIALLELSLDSRSNKS